VDGTPEDRKVRTVRDLKNIYFTLAIDFRVKIWYNIYIRLNV